MKAMSRVFAPALYLTTLLLVASCASAPQASIPPTANPNEEITRLQRDLGIGDANDFAVLDPEDFSQSRQHLHRAEEMLRNNKSQADVLSELRVARGYYERADMRSVNRRSLVESILDIRTRAVNAGAMKYPQTRKEMVDADHDLRSLADADRQPKAESVQRMQKRYADVELRALEIQQLGMASSVIEASRHAGAASRAPETYNQAKVDYLTAMNAISTNRENPAAFAAEVRQANLSADTLNKVMAIAKRDRSRFNERDAVRIVWQDRRIHTLNQDIAMQAEQSNQSLAQAESERSRLQYEMQSQQADLAKSRQALALQKALQEAQKEFSHNEAEVYQQGNNLLIRLKSIGFASGSSKVPGSAESLLAKVKNVVTELDPSTIVVQGHTDATGTKQKNEKLSEDRAESVASYLESKGIDENVVKTEGFGDSKPLASNKTRSGRAQNRRIDIIVTPSGADQAPSGNM